MNKILVIEDEEAIRDDILDIVELGGHEGLGAENGRVGLELAHKFHPNLIICDVMMPQIDGFEVLKKIRQDPNLAKVYFFLLTARVDYQDVQKGLELGANEYLAKPIGLKKLLNTINSYLIG